MSKPLTRINEFAVSKSPDHTAQDAVTFGKFALKVTIKNVVDAGGSAVYIGWNADANTINTLQPGESATYFVDGYYLDGNDLYIGFDSTTNKGQALVSAILDKTALDENCKK